ncbi:23S rRNA (guanosine(2251)-2'-O)-methyltransferase RlmB ['Cynodon dactylon' phytoplasma]|uniref:23S rRNA (guanosine(2251)-2'-O)-methyltransferase RlmB n=1 Tax='Cynodon dactylon' phytoplasma TaxID=295320 RepID=UPI001265C592|nr:23S rRNA (guanosine(2251)-2'-O)-methyltransferase RlmB ['Cynodon dactylon' phytoplasma]KAB8122004.1 23S rRNA (guanosine(2251)-2'-O)-methyltransferase RlmB ['Cynodon dactylon' phytoplasma]
MIIYGKNIIKEAIKANRVIYNLYIDYKFKDFHFLNFLKKFNINFQFLNKHQLNEKSDNSNHQGIVAEVEDYKYKNLDSFLNKPDFQKVLILDSIQDPHNLGAILRTVEASDFNGVILGNKNQVFLNGTVAKASSGALEYVNIFLVENLFKTIAKLKKYNFTIIGTDSKAKLDLEPKISLNKKFLAFILGNEGRGIRTLLKQTCDLLVKIPMKGKINSLNVSVTAALIMYSFFEKK